MKARITRGAGFAGTLDYVLDTDQKSDKDAERIAGNMCGETVSELTGEFEAVAAMRKGISKPVWHCSLSIPPGEQLDSEGWAKACESFLTKMGIDPEKTPWIAVKHNDTDHAHVHIVACRVQVDGNVWSDSFDVYHAIAATQAIEKEMGLTQTKGFDEPKASKVLSRGELAMSAATGETPPKLRIQNSINSVLAKGPITAPAFVEALAKRGVRAKPNLASTGTMNGFSFEAGDIAFKGTQLGASFKWAELQKRGISYVKDRDSEQLRSAAERTNRAPGELARVDNSAGSATGRDGGQHQGSQGRTVSIGAQGLPGGHGATPAGGGATERAAGTGSPTRAAIVVPGQHAGVLAVSSGGLPAARVDALGDVRNRGALGAQPAPGGLGFNAARNAAAANAPGARETAIKAKVKEKSRSKDRGR